MNTIEADVAACLCRVFPGMTNAMARRASAGATPAWDGGHVERLQSELALSLGVDLPWDLAWSLASFEDVVDTVVALRADRPQPGQ